MVGRHLVVFVNAAAGSVDADTDATRRRIFEAFAERAPDVEVEVEAVDPADLADRITSVWASTPRPDAIVVAGGDGTVNNAANAAVGTDVVIGVVPLGTFNHFAGDLGMPDDLGDAAAALATAEVRRVDVAEVNGRVFVNNSLVGLYPRMVEIRDQIMDDHGWGKVRAVPLATWRVLRAFPIHRIDLEGAGGFSRSRVRTPLLFIGNGVYESSPGSPPTRTALDCAVLGVEIARAESRLGLLRSAFQTLVRGASGAADVERAALDRLEVRIRSGRIRVAVDGEVDWFDAPLRYSIRPGGLSVLAPVGSSTAVDPGQNSRNSLDSIPRSSS